MSTVSEKPCCKNMGIIYGLNDKPPFAQSALAAFQHLMAMVISIGAPPLLICRALEMPPDITIYMVNIAFFASGIGTFLQTNPIGPVGSGLLCIQATSFIFPTAFIALGVAAMEANPQISKTELVALMSGATVAGSLVKIVLSRMTGLLNIVFTPIVCGITVTLVGISLLGMAMSNVVGGAEAVGTSDFASLRNLGVAFAVLLTILVFNCFKSAKIRMSAMIMGFVVGIILAWAFNMLKPMPESAVISMPMPLKYGLQFSLNGFISIGLLYIISTVEATGDLAATSLISNEPTNGPVFSKRLGGGILGDGVASLIAGIFNSFPMAIFAQNNGIIQLVGNASRHVGTYVAAYLVVLGIFPIIGNFFNIIPSPVLGGALLLLFGIITTTGMRIIFTEEITRRAILIIGLSLGVGIGAAFQPEFVRYMPKWLAEILHSPVAVGSLTAIVANLVLPKSGDETEPNIHFVKKEDKECDILPKLANEAESSAHFVEKEDKECDILPKLANEAESSAHFVEKEDKECDILPKLANEAESSVHFVEKEDKECDILPKLANEAESSVHFVEKEDKECDILPKLANEAESSVHFVENANGKCS